MQGMRTFIWVALIVVLLMVLGGGALLPVQAQGGPDATADYSLNLRTGPGTTYAAIGTIQPGTGLVLEARDAATAWVLGHSEDGALRGGVAAIYLSYRDGFTPARLPESSEVLAAPAVILEPGDAASTGGIVEPPASGILGRVPVVPVIGPRVAEIFARGQALGNNARVFTQVGECNSQSQAFMVPFAAGTYDLGPYGHLQATLDFFQQPVGGASNSFWYKGVALDTGMTSMAVIDPALSNPILCERGVSLLECEYTRSKPAVALIMLGLYDVYWLTPEQYERAMRRVVEVSIAHGVIPVLVTFPTHPGDTANWPNEAAVRVPNRVTFNETLVRLGNEYGVPVINLWRAAEALPWHGLKVDDHQHLVEPPTSGGFYRAWFTGDETQYSFTLYNLLALQTLELLRAAVLAG